MKYFDENKESSYLKYCNGNNLCEQEMSQKLPENGCKQIENGF